MRIFDGGMINVIRPARWPLPLELLAIVAVGLIASWPLFGPGLAAGHDAILATFRGVEYHEALRDGDLLPRWAPDFFFGYGYPLFHFYAPLSILLTALAMWVLSPVGSVGLVFTVTAVAGALGMYGWLRGSLGGPGALLAAGAWTFAPFHIMDVYARGGLPEFVAMACFPFVTWSLGAAVAPGVPLRGRLLRVAGAAVAFGALVLSHNVMALLFAPLAGVWLLLAVAAGGRWRLLVPGALALLLGLGLTAFFWAPALLDLGTVRPQNLTDDPLVDFRNFFTPALVSGSFLQEYGRWIEGRWSYPVEIGLVQAVLAAAGAVAGAVLLRALPGGAARRRTAALYGFGVLVCVVCLLPMLAFAQAAWEAIPLMRFVQYPWRFMGPLSLGTALLAGFLPPALALLARGRPRLRAGVVANAASLVLLLVVMVAGMGGLQLRSTLFSATSLGHVWFETLTQTIGTTSIGEYVPVTVGQVPTGSLLTTLWLSAEPEDYLEPLWGWFGIEQQTGGRDPYGTILPPVVVPLPPEAPALPSERTPSRQRFTVDLAEPATVRFHLVAWPGWEFSRDGAPLATGIHPQTGLVTAELPAGVSTIEARWVPPPHVALASTVSWFALGAVVALLVLAVVVRPPPDSAPVADDTDTGPARLAVWVTLPLIGVAAAGLAVVWSSPGSLWVDFGPAGARWYWSSDERGPRVDAGGDRLLEIELQGDGSRPLGSFVHLADAMDRVVAQYDTRLQPGVQEIPIAVPEGLPPGAYRLRAGLVDAETGRRLPITDMPLSTWWTPQPVVDLPWFPVRARPLDPAPVLLGASRLAGIGRADLPSAVGAGATLPVRLPVVVTGNGDRTLVWSLQLLDGAGRLVAQRDQQPALGAYPTTAWLPGSGYVEELPLAIPRDLAAGTYRLVLVLYDPVSGARESWEGEGEVLPLGEILVTAP